MPDGTAAGEDAGIDAEEHVDAPPGPLPIDAAQMATFVQTANTNLADVPSPTCHASSNESSDNSWYRVFSPSEHGVANRPFYVQSVSFTMEWVVGAVNATVKVGTYTGAFGANTLDLSKVTAINSTSIALPATTTGAAVVAPITATIPANAIMIVEVFVPSLVGAGRTAWIASTSSAETHFAYTRSDGCTNPTPRNIATISSDYLNSHIVITATGQY